MKFIREGECNHCGECCRKGMVAYFMTGERAYCRYQHPQTRKCRIREEYDVTKKKPDWVPAKIFKYFLEECLPYPDPNNPDHCPPIHHFLECCTFRMVRKNGN